MKVKYIRKARGETTSAANGDWGYRTQNKCARSSRVLKVTNGGEKEGKAEKWKGRKTLQ
jgi:hypothetical protein